MTCTAPHQRQGALRHTTACAAVAGVTGQIRGMARVKPRVDASARVP